ncbi:MAG: class I SAM-dependent methyltransferase [Gammaproteobacteria bacterium]
MKSLPKSPNLELLKNEAKTLRKLHHDRNSTCCSKIRLYDISFEGKADQGILDANFSTMDSQRIVAREYGYTSWAKLKHYIESLTDEIYQGVTDKHAYHQVIADSYDERSKNYNNSFWHRDLATKLVDYAPPVKDQHVLDIATGTGTIAFYAAELVGETGSVTGIDLSKGMLATCEEKLNHSELKNMVFMHEDAENLPFEACSFDRIYCASAFFWMSHPLAALRHWHELLKPNGFVAFHAWPENSEVWGNLSRIVLKRYGINFTVHQATGTENKCRELMELAGFENIQAHEVKDGHYIKLEDAKGGLLAESHYSPGQYPHPITGVPDDIIKKAHAEFDAEVEKLNTEEGVWHDMSMFYIIGQKENKG